MIIKHQHKFRKKWGQNFLKDKNLLEKIVRTVSLQSNDSILEIGPGEGSLSEIILPKIKEMAVVEIDPLLVKQLNDRIDLQRLKVIQGDILLQNIKDLPISNPVRVIGNIPYNITSPIIFWLIKQLDYWTDAYIMMQKEVAQRLTASVGSKSYGRLTVLAGAYLKTDYCFTIPPDVFIPRPKVHSSIVCFIKKNHPVVQDTDYSKFNSIVTAAFNQRRKMLSNSLKHWKISEDVKHKIDFTRRPETLTIKEFASLV